jgi:hypothetical protein
VSIYLGNAGNIELTRDSGDVIAGTIEVASVDAGKDMFSFDFSFGAFVTGDFVEFSSASTLSFISGYAYTKGNWFVNVDQLGGLRLYPTYSDAVAGTSNNRVALAVPGAAVAVNCKILNSVPRILANIIRFELSTDREAVDTSSLGDEFRNQYSTLITGSGSIDCQFDYATAGETEIAVYLHNLLLRQQFGSDFKANLYILTEGQAQGANASNDSVWYEIQGVMTNAAIQCAAGDIIESKFTFVTTGEIKLRVQTVTFGDLLLNSAGDRMVLSTADGDVLELAEEL